MHPFVISELTENKWVFKQNGGEIHPPIAADQISILTTNDIADGSSVEKWLSAWTEWDDYDKSCPEKPDFGSQLPIKKRTCQSTNNFYCLGAGEEKSWIQREQCPGLCGDLTDKDENCLKLPRDNDDTDFKWVKTKCVSSLTKPTNGQHACPAGSTKLPVPMTKAQLQAWLRGYNQCSFEFHSDKAKLPVGLLAEDNRYISLIDGANTQNNFNLNTILDSGWKKGITGCYDNLQKSSAGQNQKKCGQDGYCCSGSGKNNGEDRNNDRTCPSDAIEFIDANNLQTGHHCLRKGYYHNFRYPNS